VFADFITAIQRQAIDPYIWVGNHSALSFATKASPGPATGLQVSILILVGLVLATSLGRAIARRRRGPDAFLLLACAVGAQVIPSVSHDYTLALLAAPAVAFLTSHDGKARSGWGALVQAGWLVTFAFAYAAILFSFINRASFPFIGSAIPAFVTQNALVWILLMLLSGTGLAFSGGRNQNAP